VSRIDRTGVEDRIVMATVTMEDAEDQTVVVGETSAEVPTATTMEETVEGQIVEAMETVTVEDQIVRVTIAEAPIAMEIQVTETVEDQTATKMDVRDEVAITTMTMIVAVMSVEAGTAMATTIPVIVLNVPSSTLVVNCAASWIREAAETLHSSTTSIASLRPATTLNVPVPRLVPALPIPVTHVNPTITTNFGTRSAGVIPVHVNPHISLTAIFILKSHCFPSSNKSFFD